MSPRVDPDNKAWLTVALDLLKALMTKGFMVGLGLLFLGVFGGRQFMGSSPDKVAQELELIRKDLVEVKVNQKAFLDVLPPSQAEKAKGLVRDRLAAIALSDSTGRQ